MPAKKTTPAETDSKTIPVGKKAPAFSLKNGAGKTVKLSDFKGRKVVIYFYPKDLTPGCTTEACAFRDDYAELQARGVEVLGVSADDVASHLKFSEKYNLPFQLLSDPDHTMIEKYGAWAEKSMYGKKYWGVVRMTYIIDEEGLVTHVFPKVKPDGHSQEILAALGG
ncbi:MAG: thioredoxin-dependent thiol peroxidase [Acidobacteriota bacterium]|jgi:peroxiredoxin Q/BCP